MILQPGDRFANRYEIREPLGQGGFASIYRARDTVREADVALKIIHEHIVDAGAIDRFLHEGDLLQRLNHTNIVACYDSGQVDGRCFLALEYVPGGDLKHVLDDLRTRGDWISIEAAVDITIQVLRALSHAHRNGIVHRDLKPSNVLVGDALKLTDFGIARDEMRNVTSNIVIMGTAEYMPPEQAGKTRVDHRADLYSTGCMLYELLTGEPPFRGESLEATIARQLYETPVPPRQRNPSISRTLDRYVLRLLNKDPDRRYQTADEAREALEAHLRGEADASLVVEPLYAELGLRSTTLVGRSHEIELLDAELDRVRTEGCRIALLTGDAGMGKTRLVAEMVGRANIHGWHFALGRAFQGAQGAPYGQIVEALLAWAHDLPAAVVREAAGPYAGVLVRLLPALREELQNPPPAPSLPGREERQRLFEAVAQFAVGLLAAGPTILAVDDVQWADGETMAILEYIRRAVGTAPLLLMYTAREDEANGDRIRDLRRAIRDSRIPGLVVPLQPLARNDLSQLIRDHFDAAAVPTELATIVAQSTAGNPLFAVELLRTWKDQGRIGITGSDIVRTDDASNWAEALAIPDSIRALLSDRLTSLSENERRIVNHAAVLGRRCEFEVLLAMCRLPEEELLDDLDGLLRARVLVSKSGKDEAYEFTHPMIRDVAYEEVQGRRRRLLHRRAAEAIVEVMPGQRAPERAHHWFEGAVWDQAAFSAVEAGESSLRHWAPQHAERFFAMTLKACEHLEEDAASTADLPGLRRTALDGLGDVHSLEGNYAEAIRNWEQAIGSLSADADGAIVLKISDAAARLGDHALALAKAASVAEIAESATPTQLQASLLAARAEAYLGRLDASAQRLESARSMLDTIDDLETRISWAMVEGDLSVRLGRLANGRKAIEDGLKVAEANGHALAIGRLKNILGVIAFQEGNPELGIHTLEEAREIFQRIGAVVLVAQLNNNLGALWMHRGDPVRARNHLEEALKTAQRLDNDTDIARAAHNLSEVLLILGEPAEAAVLAQDSLERVAQRGLKLLVPAYRTTVAQAALALSNVEAALEESARAVAEADAANVAPDRAAALAVHAEAQARLGMSEAALSEFAEAIAVLKSTSKPWMLAWAHAAFAELLSARGDPAAAEHRLAAAGHYRQIGDEISAARLEAQAATLR